MADIQFIQPEGLTAPIAYTHVVTVSGGRLVLISGQVAFDEQANLVGAGDFAAQTQQVFKNLQQALKAVDADLTNIIKWNIYVVDLTEEKTDLLSEVRTEYTAGNNPPASTLIGVQGLARDGLLIEIEAIAVVD